MPLTVEQFTQRVTSSGVVTAEHLSEWLAGLPANAAARTDGEALARELVKQKKLTKFQAEQIYAGKGAALSLGNYLVLDKLGEGGMGMVLKAWHRRMERTVALKVINPKVLKEPSALKRFQREVVAAAKLTHPNIVAAYDADEAKGTHFLVMEYVEGSDLSSWVKQHGPLPVEHAVSCIIQAARGLAFAHDKGVVHRDIKPHNLLRDQDGTVKILDMGLARIEGGFGGSAEHADLTRSGAMMGTVDYMAPEQAMDSKHADARSDIYSLGCTLFYLVTGHVAFEADTVMKRLTAHQSAPPPSLVEQLKVQSAEFRDGQSAAPLDSGLMTLDAVFRRMVAKKPEDRPQSMLEVVAELERCLTSSSDTISRQSGSNPLANASSGTAQAVFQRQTTGGSSMSGSRTSPGSSSGTSAPTSERDVETIVSGSMASRTGASADATVILDSSTSTSRASSAPSNKSRKAMWISGAAVVAVLLAIVVAMSGKSQKPSDEKLVANSPNPNAQSSESPTTNTEVRESAEPNRSPTDTALMFDGDDRVEIPSLTFDPQGSYTLEGFIASPVKADQGAGLAFGMPDQSYLSFTRLSDWRWVYQPQKRSGGVEIAIAGAAARPERTHLACVRDGQTHRLFVGGKPFHKVGEIPSPSAGTSPFLIGNEFRGEIDELRMSRVARYKADFTPPARFESDADTLALYHFDEGQGDQLLDSSGNNHHGKISGAKWVMADGTPINRGAPLSTPPALAKAPFDGKQARAHQEAWAKHLGTQVETTNSVGAKMILIPPGEFLMGSTDEQLAPVVKEVAAVHGQELADRIRKAEQPQHRVVLTKPFWMGATEVTIGQFRKFVEATKYQTHAEKVATDAKSWTYLKPGYAVTDESPAAAVCWDDADAYCRWLSQQEQATYRLPTEAEWEFACRAGTTTAYSCGDQLLDSHEWSIRNSEVKSHPVATKQPNPFGLFDMHGNLSEWCRDCYDEKWYAQSPPTDPIGPKTGTAHVLRGGNWDYNSFLRSAFRTGRSEDVFHYTIGFRVVRELEASVVVPAKNIANNITSVTGDLSALQLDPKGRIEIPLRLLSNSAVTYEFEVTRKPPGSDNLHYQLAMLIRGNGLKQYLQNITIANSTPETISISTAVPDHDRFIVAATATETTFRIFINGRQVTEKTLPTPHPSNGEQSIYVGYSPGAPSNFRAYDAPLHRFRLSRGERYSSNYDPSGEWLPDEQTLVLYDFRHGGGNDQVLDLSSNKMHGKVVGAKWVTSAAAALPATPPQTIPWTDWLGPKLKQGKFFSHFDGRQGWQQEGEAITTTSTISGQEVMRGKTRDGAVRLTYLLRDSKGIQINACDRAVNNKRELYVAEDHGTKISITLVQAGTLQVLAKETIPESIPRDAPRTLEFRIVGDTLMATLNGSVVATVKDATLSEGNFALVALKGVLVQKVEYQKLDEPKQQAQ